MSTDKLQSSPNLRCPPNETDFRRLFSLSLSQIDKSADIVHLNYKPSPFIIRWIYGYNSKVGVINLNGNGKTVAFYAACNCGVLYDWTKHQMKILQGHKHIVTNIAASDDGKTLVTADSGVEDIIIIWDSYDCFPLRTIFNPDGCVKLAKVTISSDAKYLLTLGYQEKAVVNWWIWSHGRDSPDATHEVNIGRGGVVDVGFNPNNSDQFVLLAKYDLWLGTSAKIYVTEIGVLKETDDFELKIRMLQKKPTPEYGRFLCFTFVKGTSQILVATTRGHVLVYSNTIECIENVPLDYEKLKFIKMLNIENKGINAIKSIDGVIVTGNTAGEVKFYDNHMKLLYWMHGLQVDNIKGLSFDIMPRKCQILNPKCKKLCPCWDKIVPNVDSSTGVVCQKLMKQDLPSDASAANKSFLVRDFIVYLSLRKLLAKSNYVYGNNILLRGKLNQNFTLASHNQGIKFVEFPTEKLFTILDCKISSALAVTVHPEKPFVCVGFADGVVELYNYAQRKLFLRIDLRDHYKRVFTPNEDSIRGDTYVEKPQFSVTCLKYSPSGLHLACGLDLGELIFLHPSVLNILDEKRASSHAITQIKYTNDSLTLASADKGRNVCVYKYDCSKHIWNLIGKHKAHYKNITSLFFLPQKKGNGELKLLSLSLDRMLVEYDISGKSEECLKVSRISRVEQTYVPLAGMPWPTPANLDHEHNHVDLPLFLIANDEFKYKIINNASAMTLSTLIGPRYEHPVCRMKLVTRKMADHEEQYMVFATRNVIGLQKLPLDGNPWKHVGLLGHPVQVLDISFHEENRMLFTVGSKDSCIIQWEANYNSADISTKHGGEELDPYYCLFENGRPGWLFQEIRDLFYYVQILCQGTFSPAVRRVKDHIPIDSLPDLMRTLGYFPSNYEVENLITEAKNKVYQREPSNEINFEEFVKLYLNHRPAFGDSYKKIRNAFRHFADIDNDSYSMTREEFVDVLTTNGECFSRELCWYLLSVLCGHSFEERANMTEGDFSFLPERITLREFLTSILGMQEMDWSDQSVKESIYSTGTSSTATGSSEPLY